MTKNIFLESITNEIIELDIAGYIKEEAKCLFKSLHYYKIKNIHENIESLKNFLLSLDDNSTKQINILEYNENIVIPDTKYDISYYISKKGLITVEEHKISQKIGENNYGLSYIMQAVRGLLLLKADEFCNATPTRIAINKLLQKKYMAK